MPRLENWAIFDTGDPYAAPETRKAVLGGEVYDHPRFEDGQRITTSYIVSVDGNNVVTYSGSNYTLGNPSDDFIQWCKDNGHYVPTPDVPIKF